jgi:hypothetical protein
MGKREVSTTFHDCLLLIALQALSRAARTCLSATEATSTDIKGRKAILVVVGKTRYST